MFLTTLPVRWVLSTIAESFMIAAKSEARWVSTFVTGAGPGQGTEWPLLMRSGGPLKCGSQSPQQGSVGNPPSLCPLINIIPAANGHVEGW